MTEEIKEIKISAEADRLIDELPVGGKADSVIALRAHIAELEKEKTCVWTQSVWTQSEPDYDENWETDCGGAFTFIDGGPSDNNFQFCYRCGGKLVVKLVEEEET